MVVVSDSTTLIILNDLNKLDYLKNLFSKVYIPQKVYEEISYKKEFLLPSFMEVIAINESEQLNELKMLLDDGESEAISLALEKKLPLIIDEKKVRKIALNLNIQILGLLGVLYLNIKKEYISKDEVKKFLKIAKNMGYRISQKLIDDILEKLINILY